MTIKLNPLFAALLKLGEYDRIMKSGDPNALARLHAWYVVDYPEICSLIDGVYDEYATEIVRIEGQEELNHSHKVAV